MKRIVLNFEHKTSYTSVDEAFAAYATEAHKMDDVLANLGLSVWVDSTNYAIGIKDSNDVVKVFLILALSKSTSMYTYTWDDARAYPNKTGAFSVNTTYLDKLTSEDLYYSMVYDTSNSNTNYSPYHYLSRTYYTGQASQTLWSPYVYNKSSACNLLGGYI